MNALFLDADFLRKEITLLQEVYPELAEDETLRADMIEGETGLVEISERILSAIRDDETMAAAAKARKGDIGERQARFERSADAKRKLLRTIMRAGGLTKLQLTEATLSIHAGRVSVVVNDVNELPQGYFKLVREADKPAIKASLEKGEPIPGAELVTGEAGLTIRTK